jgi:opacity protein-like surface antigen
VALAGAAQAQSLVDTKGYAEGFAQSAFGNVTSQSYGGEVGVALTSVIQVYGEFAYVKDTAPSSLAANAQQIVNYLAQTETNVGYHAEQPATMGGGGLRFRFGGTVKAEPYLLIGLGVAKVEKKVSFTINGTDVTSNLPQYGVVLGTDLSGTETKAMLSLGGGVAWAVWGNLLVDFQYRYGRVFTDEGLNINRAGVGIGVRF